MTTFASLTPPFPAAGCLDYIITRIRDRSFGSIITLSGAGISVNSGIPDFRSPGGMYDTLQPHLLTATPEQQRAMQHEPTLVVDYSLFKVNQLPYLEVRRPFILGTAENQWKPTAAHFFIQLLHDKGLLHRHYTANIDGLDHQLPLPKDTIVNLHGSLAEIKCEFCGTPHDSATFRDNVRAQIRNIYDPNDPTAPIASTNILCESCNRPGVKPATVLYGRDLPRKALTSITEDFPRHANLLIVLGTSLTVSPSNGLANHVFPHVSRLVLNKEVVGMDLGLDFGLRNPRKGLQPENIEAPYTDNGHRDCICLTDCDSAVLYLCKRLDWLSDLIQYREGMCPLSQEKLDSAIQEISN